MGEKRLLAPSTLSVAPLIKAAPGERRKQTADETYNLNNILEYSYLLMVQTCLLLEINIVGILSFFISK